MGGVVAENVAEKADEEQGVTSDLARLIGEKVCRKASLVQLFFSLNVDLRTAMQF